MPLTQNDFATLHTARAGYRYPPEVWSKDAGGVIRLADTAAVETYIGSRLRSGVPAQTREGLASVLAWGFANAGYRVVRVRKFLAEVREDQIAAAGRILRGASAPPASASECVLAITQLHLPQFSQMAFVSKIAMFLDPSRFPVLDSKIADLLVRMPIGHPVAGLTRYPNSIPVTQHNAAVYDRWARACVQIAQTGNLGSGRAVDAERAFFRLHSALGIGGASAILARWP